LVRTAAKPLEVASASCDFSSLSSDRSDSFSLLNASNLSSFRFRDLAADKRFRCIRSSLRCRLIRSCSVSLGATSSSDSEEVWCVTLSVRRRLRQAVQPVDGGGEEPLLIIPSSEDRLDDIFHAMLVRRRSRGFVLCLVSRGDVGLWMKKKKHSVKEDEAPRRCHVQERRRGRRMQE